MTPTQRWTTATVTALVMAFYLSVLGSPHDCEMGVGFLVAYMLLCIAWFAGGRIVRERSGGWMLKGVMFLLVLYCIGYSVAAGMEFRYIRAGWTFSQVFPDALPAIGRLCVGIAGYAACRGLVWWQRRIGQSERKYRAVFRLRETKPSPPAAAPADRAARNVHYLWLD
jgi:hypothetical protein